MENVQSEKENLGSVLEPVMRIIENDTLAYRVIFAKILKSPVAAIVLSQYLYWARNRKSVERGGWFYKTESDFYEETGVSEKSQRTARKILCSRGILLVEKRGVPSRNWYKIDYQKLANTVFTLVPPAPIWDDKNSQMGTTGGAEEGALSTTESTTESTHTACVLEKLKSDTGSVSGGQYSPDGFSPVDRLAMKRRAEKALGFKRANKWSQLLFGSAWDFRTAFKKYEGYDYPDPILLDEVAKTLAHWFELGETRDSIRDMLIAFFEGKKHEKVTITPNSVFSSHTYNSWKQNKL